MCDLAAQCLLRATCLNRKLAFPSKEA